jgi:hypothetical protein
MTKFTYNDIIKISTSASTELRPGQRAWIIGVFEDRPEKYFKPFPKGVVYSIEFEDGASIEVHESDLEPFA